MSNPVVEVDRRTALQKLSVAGATLVFGSSAASAKTDENNSKIQKSNNNQGISSLNTSIVQYGNSVKSLTNHPELLTLPKDSIDGWFEASDLEGREFEDTRQYVKELRKRYPVEKVQDGNISIIQLTEKAKQTLNDERRRQNPITEDNNQSKPQGSDTAASVFAQSQGDKQHRDAAFSIFSRESQTDSGDDQSVRIQWKAENHNSLAEPVVNTFDQDIPSKGETLLTINADDPDEWAYDINDKIREEYDPNIPGVDDDSVVDVITKANQVLNHNLAQYYDPDVFVLYEGHGIEVEFETFGLADIFGPKPFHTAQNKSSTTDKYTKLGHAFHFIQDMAMPLHTGMAFEQAGFELKARLVGSTVVIYAVKKSKKDWLHDGVEVLVKHNWAEDPDWDGPVLKDALEGSDIANSSSVEDALQTMAQTSSQFSVDIYHTVMKNEYDGKGPGNWEPETKEEIWNLTYECFGELGDQMRWYLDNV